jgi:hypothetical protein
MSGRRRWAGLALAAAVTITAGGCASAASPARPGTAPPPLPALPGLTSSLVTADGSWAVAVMGGSAAATNNFWQLFARPAGSSAWRLVTPPGVASNGGLTLASLGGQSVLAGFRPSQDLVFSPLASTSDDGASWSSGVLDAALANVPDALAAAPGGDQLLALLSNGRIERAGRGASAWSTLTSLRSLAASPAGRRCAPSRLTAVAFAAGPVSAGTGSAGTGSAGTGSAATALAGATCARGGQVGIFSYTPGANAWRAAAPALPAVLAGRPVQVLRLTSTTAGEVALLSVGSGASTELLAAWSSDGTRWTVSAPLSAPDSAAAATGFSAGGDAWVLTASGQADVIAAKGSAWQQLPPLPPHTALLAFGQASASGSTSNAPTSSHTSTTGPTGNSTPAAGIEALATFGSKFTVWSLTGSGAAAGWHSTQALTVPIQYGSSS